MMKSLFFLALASQGVVANDSPVPGPSILSLPTKKQDAIQTQRNVHFDLSKNRTRNISPLGNRSAVVRSSTRKRLPSSEKKAEKLTAANGTWGVAEELPHLNGHPLIKEKKTTYLKGGKKEVSHIVTVMDKEPERKRVYMNGELADIGEKHYQSIKRARESSAALVAPAAPATNRTRSRLSFNGYELKRTTSPIGTTIPFVMDGEEERAHAAINGEVMDIGKKHYEAIMKSQSEVTKPVREVSAWKKQELKPEESKKEVTTTPKGTLSMTTFNGYEMKKTTYPTGRSTAVVMDGEKKRTYAAINGDLTDIGKKHYARYQKGKKEPSTEESTQCCRVS